MRRAGPFGFRGGVGPGPALGSNPTRGEDPVEGFGGDGVERPAGVVIVIAVVVVVVVVEWPGNPAVLFILWP